ncbi:MAG: DJ-1/PfpI family protein [Candidatus Micrarchaeota archaeon]
MMAEEAVEMVEVKAGEKKVLMVIAARNFRDEEYFHPKQVFLNHGLAVVTASTEREAVSKFGARVKADWKIHEVSAGDYSAVVFVGGSGASVFFHDHAALELAKAFFAAGKAACAICIGPSVLANAGVLQGKRATCFEGEAENLKAHGAQYTGEPVTVDGNIVTANGPLAAKEFGEAVVKAILSLNPPIS